MLLLAAAAAAAAIVLAVSMPSSAGHRAPLLPRSGMSHLTMIPPDLLATGSHVALGVAVDGPPLDALRQFTALVSVRPQIAVWFQSWDEPLLYVADLDAASAIGATPMITWDPIRGGIGVPLSQIADGEDDSFLRASAELAAAYGQRLYIRFGHEMNLRASPFGAGHPGDTPQTYVAAWRHVVAIFRQAGANNVEFVWSPNVYCEGRCPFTAYYPGDAWVDWVALDGYNYGPVDHDRWRSFAQLFGPSYNILTSLTDKPLMIAETASGERGGSKANWIAAMGQTLATRFRRVRALIWFQRVKETDWRVNSSPASLRAFRELVSSPLFLH